MIRRFLTGLAALAIAAPAYAQTSITDFGASLQSADNTAAINKCLEAAAHGSFHCHRPPGYWRVTGTLRVDVETGQIGAGFDGPGIVREDSNNVPIFVYGGVGGQAFAVEGNFQYLHWQPPENKNAACIRVDLPTIHNSVYNGFLSFQCTNAYHGLDQKLGAFWGNVMPWIDCKNNSGACIDLHTNFQGAQPNNYFGHVYINPAATACGGDPAEIHLEFAANNAFDNVELNNGTCPLFFGQNNRGTLIRNVRFEHGTISDPKFAHHAIIEVVGDGALIEQLEVQTLTVDVKGDFAVFRDSGAWGPADTLIGALNLYSPVRKSGHLYGITSPHNVVHSAAFFPWYGDGNYDGDVSPDSPFVNP